MAFKAPGGLAPVLYQGIRGFKKEEREVLMELIFAVIGICLGVMLIALSLLYVVSCKSFSDLLSAILIICIAIILLAGSLRIIGLPV